MSRAVVYCPWPGRPWGLMKRVDVIPRRAASAFIITMNSSSVPPTVSAMATATSFADLTKSSLRALSSVSFEPGLKYILLAGWSAALLLMTTSESSDSSPDRNALKAT